MTTQDGRSFVQYVDDDGGEISLPGYLDARPSIVSPGDVFSILEEYADEVLASDRFVESDVPEPYPGMTKAEIVETYGLDVNPDANTRDELVVLADDRARMFPPVPNEEPRPEELEPVPGQIEDPNAGDPADDPNAGDPAGDSDEKGGAQ